jgi:predicted helicase
MAFAFENDEFLEEKIKSRIVKKVGNRREWADWAEDVGVICQNQIKHIGAVLDNPENVKSIQAFEEFSEELKATLNGELTKEAIVEMLGQHVVTKPIIDALFADYPFTEKNPISQAMTSMMDALDKDGMQTATQLLKGFYEAVQLRTKNIKTGADRQTVILELFDKFFSAAFPKMRDKLGIVYTPVEIVDFINQSVADLLKKEFGMNISDEGVHILDPFVGTGTFMTRLLQSGLIPKEKLQEKFDHDLHAHEIVPLAYYIASMNLESTLHDLVPTSEYKPNNVMVWTDTFADNHVEEDFFHTSLGANNKRLAENQKLDIRIIIGNPPYSVGQASANDDNANEHYALLDQRIAETYAAQTEATNKNSLYDSYIRGYRWAADRIKNKGIIGFVTNAGWIESNSADGLRKCMAEEFNSIYIYHLKGNQRTSGEISRREGGKIFGEGSRAPIAIVLLVKNPASQEKGKIYFKAVDDYLTREQKLMQVRSDKSILSLNFEVITPDSHGDWLNQRNNDFSKFIRIDGKKTEEKSLFANYSRGLSTARDPWVYNSSSIQLYGNIKRMFDIYLKQLGDYEKNPDTFSFIRDEKRIHWNRTLENYFKRFNKPVVDKSKTTIALYRPFVKQYCYFDKFANDMTYQLPLLFNDGKASNLVICINQNAKTDAGQIALMTNTIPDLHFNGDSQCFPRWLSSEPQSASDLFVAGSNKIIQHDAITDCALNDFQLAYKDDLLTKDDIFYYVYGVLHSKEYRSLFANNLSKELPRIPRVATYSDFKKFEIAGRKLADLHVNYESVTPYAGLKIEMKAGASFRVTQMRYGKLAGRTGNAAKDRTRVIYNEDISIDNIPIEAHEYIVNKKSALDWIVERCCVSIDKQSGIVNDFNLYGEELGNSRYIFDLIPRIITVSLETMKIVKSLPKLEIHPLDK